MSDKFPNTVFSSDSEPLYEASSYLRHVWPGPFKFHTACFDNVYSTKGADKTIQEVSKIYTKANPNAGYKLYTPSQIENTDLEWFVHYAFLHYEYFGNARTENLSVELDIEKVLSYMSPKRVEHVYSCFREVAGVDAIVRKIILSRRVDYGKYIEFHTSDSPCTLELALNGENDYTGGRLVYLYNDLFDSPQRPAGTITVHADDIVHGVTKLESGVRCSMYFCA
jgi:hypothetical protein